LRYVLPPAGFFVERNVPKLQFVPILIEEDGGYPYEANRYLVERSCGEWSTGHGKSQDPVVLTIKSRINMASRLCAFFYWCGRKKGRDWRKMDYQDHVLAGFQADLLTGKGSATGRKLDEATVNLYVDEACLFLTWAAERGYRTPFKVPRRRVPVRRGRGDHSLSHVPDLVAHRQGRFASKQRDLSGLPSNLEVERWLKSVSLRGPVKALEFEFMLRTGARITEANELRASCIPRKDVWKPAWVARLWIPVTLRYGVKGRKVEPASMRSTRPRPIELPIDLAERIEHYIAFVRPTQLSRFHRGQYARTARTDRLWLGEHTNQPFAYSTLYKAWTECPHCPDGWHPHMARHFFAVERICQATRDLLRSRQIEDPGGVGIGWLHGLMAGQVRLLLSPLLGHVDDRTTMLYLECARQRMINEFGHPAIRWNAIIDDE
jgi:hypothetical protein